MTDIESRGLFLRGGFVPCSSGKTFPVYDPHTDEVYAKVAEAGTADVDAAVDAAREAFDGPWSALAPKDRGRLLLKLARMIQEHGEALAQVAARNTVVLKPAEYTPMSALEVARLSVDAGFPPGTINVVPGKGSVAGARLARHPDVAKICFTGSVEVGQDIIRAGADTLKKPLLELGGKGPNIVFADADLAAAVQGSLFAAYHNQGQACIAGSRLFVHESIWDDFLKRFTARVRSIRIGNPLEEATQLGPLTSKDHQKRVLGYVDIAKGEGGQVLFGGRTPGTPETARGYYVQPTLVRADEPK